MTGSTSFLGWRFRSSVDIGNSPIWLLGKCYHFEERKGRGVASWARFDLPALARTGAQRDHSGTEGAPPHVLAFLQHYHSLTWMTYRTNFDPIPGTVLTSDCGWGCMIRSGQMLFATALHRHLLNGGTNKRGTQDSSHYDVPPSLQTGACHQAQRKTWQCIDRCGIPIEVIAPSCYHLLTCYRFSLGLPTAQPAPPLSPCTH